MCICVKEKRGGYASFSVSVLPQTGHSWNSPLDSVELSGNPARSDKKTWLHTAHLNFVSSLILIYSFLCEMTLEGRYLTNTREFNIPNVF